MKGGAYRRERSRPTCSRKKFSFSSSQLLSNARFSRNLRRTKGNGDRGNRQADRLRKKGFGRRLWFLATRKSRAREKERIRKGKIDFVYKKSAEIDSVSREENPTDSEKTESVGLFIVYRDYITFFAVVKRALPTFFRFREKFFQGEKGGRFGPPRPPILRASIVRKKRTLFKEKSTKYANKRSISPCYFCRNMIQ